MDGKSERAKASPVPILIGDLPRAEEEALRVFTEIPGNLYQNSSLGKSRHQEDYMGCDCVYEPGHYDVSRACGEGSNCINRLTLVECIEGECPSRSHCQNQRFQKRQFSDVHIVQTEKKGFGLRAGSNIPADAFIYEYIGEVVTESSFMKRMRAYAAEGIRHFYFMMLQKDEFLDATKKGGIGRFANHSCNPNCYVSKWFVGKKVRMGIFAKRAILKDEELTFNYNVDRYGHDAQTCYCGEPNCVGFIGGKTQTDIGGIDDLYIDALGITDEVEALELRGTKKKKAKKLGEDFHPVLSPIEEHQVPEVLNAIRRASGSNQKMLPHLLTRIKLTQDATVLSGIMRLRGFSLMSSLLMDHSDQEEIIKLILESIVIWPLMNRNKVEDSKIEEPVTQLKSSPNEEMKSLAEKLLEQWSTLEAGYRIPKRLGGVTEVIKVEELRPGKRRKIEEEELPEPDNPIFLPLGFRAANHGAPKAAVVAPVPPPPPPTISRMNPTRAELDQIIAMAIAERNALAAATPPTPVATGSTLKAEERRPKSNGASSSKPKSQDDKANKDKRLIKLVGEVVVKCMSRYVKELGHDTFKQQAKELTHLIAEKEKKSSSYQSGKLDKLSEEKQKKIKKFVHDYVKKILKKLQTKNSKHANPGATGSTETTDTSNSPDDPSLFNGSTAADPEAAADDDDDDDDDDMLMDLSDDEKGDPSPGSAMEQSPHSPAG